MFPFFGVGNSFPLPNDETIESTTEASVNFQKPVPTDHFCNSIKFSIMREIVHMQAGQCGNQIGAKVNILLSDSFTNKVNYEALKQILKNETL